MKKKLNILCLLLFLTLFASLSFNIVGGVEGVNEAWSTVQNESGNYPTEIPDKSLESSITGLYPIRVIPTAAGTYTDSVYNNKTGAWIPIQYSEIITKVSHPVSKLHLVGILILAVSYLLALGVGFICFLKLIRDINKSIIFEWKNVRNLNWLGGTLITAFFISFLLGYLNYSLVAEHVAINSYKIDWSGIAQTMNLILGLATLLVAEIFSLGLRLKEEQELTI